MSIYDVCIIGAGAAGEFAAYEFTKMNTNRSVIILDQGLEVEKRICPITAGKVDHCINCKPVCAIMCGFGGAGALSDGKYNITNDFGGDLHQYIGAQEAIELMEYVDDVLCEFDGHGSKLYSTASSDLKRVCLQNNLHLLDARVRHFGTDRNVEILKKVYEYTKDKIEYSFKTRAETIVRNEDGTFTVQTDKIGAVTCKNLVLATGRSGSSWTARELGKLGITMRSDRVDIGVRVEIPAEIFAHITDKVYESKIVYQTERYNDLVRTFCMNPKGVVVTENTNGIITVNGHSYSDPSLHTENTNFALLVTNRFTEPFKDSNEYGESIARLSNMLGGGVLLQRFGDLIRGRRSGENRMRKCFTRPTLKATPGDLSLVLPKRQLDDIIEMIYALDKVAPGMANEDTLLYGVEVKFYNSEVPVDKNLMTEIPGLYAVGDGSGVTHSLSQASACGVVVARVLG